MILLVGRYNETHDGRAQELEACLERNLRLDHIEQVHVFFEDDAPPLLCHPKLKAVQFGRRLQFRDLFDYANHELGGQLCIIANNDISFDESLGELVGYDMEDKLLCLSRWETQPDGQVVNGNYENSHDAWIFRSPIRSFPCDWYLGLLASDTRLAYEARAAGMTLLNPCQSIRAVHLHLTGVHHYSQHDWVYGPQGLVLPQSLHEAPKDSTLGYFNRGTHTAHNNVPFFNRFVGGGAQKGQQPAPQVWFSRQIGKSR
jgi:hypothetical protein